MIKKGVSFDEVYDRFAVRIIYKSSLKNEKFLAWKIYSIVTDFFTPNPIRLRDWISSPRSTGYEALHITVVGPKNRWVKTPGPVSPCLRRDPQSQALTTPIDQVTGDPKRSRLG